MLRPAPQAADFARSQFRAGAAPAEGRRRAGAGDSRATAARPRSAAVDPCLGAEATTVHVQNAALAVGRNVRLAGVGATIRGASYHVSQADLPPRARAAVATGGRARVVGEASVTAAA